MNYGGIYRTGTISVAAAGTQVTGLGTFWSPQIEEGDFLVADGVVAIVDTVADNTTIALAAPWPGQTLSGASYLIVKTSWLRYDPALTQAKLRQLLAAQAVSGFFWFVDAALSEPDPSVGDDGQFARQPSTGKEWLKTGGVWVYQGITGNLSVSSTPWSAGTTYTKNVLVPFQGSMWLSLQPNNLGHQPDLSPTFWELVVSGGDRVYIAMDDSDQPATGETVLKWTAPEAVTFYAGLSKSFANAGIAATANAIYSIRKNGVQFATLTFAAGAQAGVFAAPSNATFAAGDVLTIVAPTPRDATLSAVSITLTAYR